MVEKKHDLLPCDQEAILRIRTFKLIEKFQTGLWVEAKPRTGRTHQIRVHLSEAGLSILGDPVYGKAQAIQIFSVPRLMLHASSLTFRHPIDQTEVKIKSPLPEDFTKCLQEFKKIQL